LPCRSDADPDRLFCQLRNESGKQEPVYRWTGLLIRSSFACSQDAAGRQDKNWLTEGYTDSGDEDKKRRQALRVLTAFFPVFQSTWQQMVYTEHLINTKLDGIPFTGIVDRINDSSFRRTISAKTSRRRWTKGQRLHCQVPRGSCNNCPQDSSGRFSWKTRQQVFLLRLQKHLFCVPPHLALRFTDTK